MPASIVARHAGDGDGEFVLQKALDNCVKLYPMSAWARVSRRVNQLDDMVPGPRKFKRMFFATAKDVKLDGNSRISIPAFLAGHAGIDRDVVIIGVGDYYEMWNPQAYEAELTAGEDMGALAARVFGSASQRA